MRLSLVLSYHAPFIGHNPPGILTQEAKKLLLYIRLALLTCVVLMLGVALFWSPQCYPNPRNGVRQAYCEFTMPVDNSLFSEFEFPVQHKPLNFAGVMQSVLLIWGN